MEIRKVDFRIKNRRGWFLMLLEFGTREVCRRSDWMTRFVSLMHYREWERCTRERERERERTRVREIKDFSGPHRDCRRIRSTPLSFLLEDCAFLGCIYKKVLVKSFLYFLDRSILEYPTLLHWTCVCACECICEWRSSKDRGIKRSENEDNNLQSRDRYFFL